MNSSKPMFFSSKERDFHWQEEIASVPSPNDSYDVVVRKVGRGKVVPNDKILGCPVGS